MLLCGRAAQAKVANWCGRGVRVWNTRDETLMPRPTAACAARHW